MAGFEKSVSSLFRVNFSVYFKVPISISEEDGLESAVAIGYVITIVCNSFSVIDAILLSKERIVDSDEIIKGVEASQCDINDLQGLELVNGEVDNCIIYESGKAYFEE